MLKKSFLISTSLVIAGAMATPVFAQVDDEIIVTATKRETTLQATPVAVSVTSADVIEKAQILDIADLQSVVPSLRVTQLQSSQNTNFIVRGFGNGANNAGIEPSVGVFIDGVYRSRSAAQIGDLPKLQRVEVLKGPQSTLFGKNASAGVISVVTAKPQFETEGYLEVGIANYDGRLLRGYATGGLSENLAVSLGGSIQKRDGYSESQIDGVDDFNDRDRFNIRGQALYQPTDNVEFRLIADLSRIDENCCAVTNVQNAGASAAVAALGGRFANDLDPFAYESFVNKNSQNTVDDMGVSFHADVDFGWANLTSISAYRENHSIFDQDADFNSLELLRDVNSDQEIATFTQELRLSSSGDNQFDWMIGGYFFSEDISQVGGLEYGGDLQNYINVLLQQGTGIPSLLNTLEPLYGAAPGTFLGAGTQTREAFEQDNTAYSLFGTVDYDVSERLTLTVGGNFTDDRKSVSSNVVNGDVFSSIDLVNDPTVLGVTLPQVFFGQFFTANTAAFGGLAPTPANIALVESLAPGTSAAIQAGVNALVAGIQGTQFQPQFINFPNSVESGKTNDDKFTYIARAAYEVNDSLNVYASYGTGFKATSWNLGRDSRPFASDAAALGSAGLLPANAVFRTRFAGPEEARVIEAGAKMKFDNGNLNIAVFDQTIEGFQSNVFLGTGFTLLNAGQQSTFGAEVDGSYTLADALTLSFAGTFLDPKYDEFTAAQGASVNGVPTDLSGETVAGISEVSLSLGATYNYELDNGMAGFLRGDFQYESPTQIVDGIPTATNSAGETSAIEREVKTFNASAGLDFGNGVSLQLWGRNLFNDQYFLSVFPGVAQAGVIQTYPNQPRTYGANLRLTF